MKRFGIDAVLSARKRETHSSRKNRDAARVGALGFEVSHIWRDRTAPDMEHPDL
jgi:hypothetical protein